jgi:hypothetical protein
VFCGSGKSSLTDTGHLSHLQMVWHIDGVINGRGTSGCCQSLFSRRQIGLQGFDPRWRIGDRGTTDVPYPQSTRHKFIDNGLACGARPEDDV